MNGYSNYGMPPGQGGNGQAVPYDQGRSSTPSAQQTSNVSHGYYPSMAYNNVPSTTPGPTPEQSRSAAAAAGAQRMAMTTLLASHPTYARGQRLGLLEYVYAQPSRVGPSKKRKVLGLDGACDS